MAVSKHGQPVIEYRCSLGCEVDAPATATWVQPVCQMHRLPLVRVTRRYRWQYRINKGPWKPATYDATPTGGGVTFDEPEQLAPDDLIEVRCLDEEGNLIQQGTFGPTLANPT